MVKFLNRLERKFGRYAIRNLSKYVIYGYIIGYILTFLGSGISRFLRLADNVNLLSYISLNPYLIIHGQIWRLVTWVIIPPEDFGLFTIIMLLVYYSLGSTLERTWGTFRFNLYIFSGILFSVIGAFILYGLYYLAGFTAKYPMEMLGSFIALNFRTYYINMSIFLAFAAEYPNMQMLLYFVIPVKIKWLAIIDVILIGYEFIMGSWEVKVAIIASLLNLAVFFFSTRNYKQISPKEIYRKRAFRNTTSDQYSSFGNGKTASITKHKCAICGRTEKDGDNLEFRFCSKCNGNYEYCNEHLFTHQHIV